VRSVQWWKQHWKKTALVDVQCGELLAESDEVLRAKLMSASKRTAPQRPDIGREKALRATLKRQQALKKRAITLQGNA
jgi:hypothetical protein